MTGLVARFVASGIAATAVHALVALWLVHRLDQPQTVANALAFASATAVSYFSNTVWTFSASITRLNIVRYGCVTALGLLWSSALGHLGDRCGWEPVITIVVTVLTAPPIVFMLHSRWTYAGSTR